MDQQSQPLADEPSPAAEAGNRHAQFLALYLASEKAVFRDISALVPCATEVQALVQQTAPALWRKFADFDSRQPFTPWACRVALLEVPESLRRRREWQALLGGDLAEELVRRRASLRGHSDRQLAFLPGCLDKLPSHQRALVENYYYERQDGQEVTHHDRDQ